MPYVVQGSPHTNGSAGLRDIDHGYQYPLQLDLRPGGKLHDKIKDEIMKRARESNSFVSNRFSSWREIDRTLTCYVELDDDEKDLQDRDPRRPVSIVFPYSYTVMETIVSYLMGAFLQDPIFRYEAVSPEDTLGAIMLEKVVDVHCNRSKVGLAIHTMLRDAIAYGIGPVSPGWRTVTGYKRYAVQNPYTGGVEMQDRESILFEGNYLRNIDPYLYLPDPSVSAHNVQEGEYVGWVEKTNYMNLLSLERDGLGAIFNVKYLKNLNSKGSTLTFDHSDRETKFGGPADRSSYEGANPVDVIYMYIKIIPQDWGLSPNTYPEKWLFAVGNDEVVIEARPANFNHNLFPIGVAAPDYDGYSPLPLSRMELFYGLQHVLDFLFNSHISNVRKAVNDMIVYDPHMINTPDLENPAPGKLIRMRRPGWGRGVKDSIMQLGITDITQRNIEDSSYIVQWMQKIGAVDDAAMGSLRQGGPERLTAGEFQGTRSGLVSRLDRITKVIGMQALHDIGYMFAVHTQQMMSLDLYVTTTGRWQETLMSEYQVMGNKMKVTPYDLLVDYDVFVRDGASPGGNFSESWIQLWQSIASNPALMQTFDVVRIFKHMARGMGAKNVDDFVNIQYKMVSDQQALAMAQQGQIQPMGQMVPGATEQGIGGPGGYQQGQ